MRIAVDAMGGDFAPKEIVRGAIDAAKKYDCEIVLVGDEAKIRAELGGADTDALH
ncbi:MAG: phosphate acyltransferase, partial [Selenomonas sp.]|nr:phosphate acyltransferase [Selenomonas sp.]